MDDSGREALSSDFGANRTAFGDAGLDGAMLEVGALSGLTSTMTGLMECRRDEDMVVGGLPLTKGIDGDQA